MCIRDRWYQRRVHGEAIPQPSPLTEQEFLTVTNQDTLKIGLLTRTTTTNDIWTSSQYQDNGFRQDVMKSFYNQQFGEEKFGHNEVLNNETWTKKYNTRKTPISEYSNALHNGRVFVNPKFTSC
eukprot:TRINITY_DN6364_c0_g1_i1.p1 TRINITY_DN6364_c0_g1~~TRINITY_DN6364_c0_g1_i1.p1  ORF type:complete len:124 (+),score=26.20 TRINITY_DN6364_c0_g1_i1:64-435(+)